MKRGIIAFSLVTAIAVLSCFASIAVINRANSLKEIALYACESQEYIDPLKNCWQKNKDFFSLFVSHIHLEPIEQRINSIEYVGSDEIEESCAEIVAFAEEIGELMKVSVYNIF